MSAARAAQAIKGRLGDLEVNRLGFGAMRVVGNDRVWGEPRDRGHAHKVLRRAFELGMNFFDTAESYGPHTDEILIAEALHPYPKELVVATKCGLTRPRPGRGRRPFRPCRLGTDLDPRTGAGRERRRLPVSGPRGAGPGHGTGAVRAKIIAMLTSKMALVSVWLDLKSSDINHCGKVSTNRNATAR